VRIKIPPRTPKAGSILVSSSIGLGVGDVVDEVEEELDDCDTEELESELVRDGVTVTLNVVGMRVETGTTVVPERLSMVDVIVLVITVR
jgi:hypothetical protein